MANLHSNHYHVTSFSGKLLFTKTLNPVRKTTAFQQKKRRRFTIASLGDQRSGSALVQQRPPPNHEEAVDMIDQAADMSFEMQMMNDEKKVVMIDEYLVREYGWKVRRMVEDKNEMRNVARIQAEAFHVPSLFFDDWFFQFFLLLVVQNCRIVYCNHQTYLQAEVLSGLLYRLRNSPPNRYACLVAEPKEEDDETSPMPQTQDQRKLVGVVDVTVLRDSDVLRHLEGAQEYLYVSGIAVANNYRRQKVATVLLKACEVISVIWGYEYLVLRAYEDDKGARALYTDAGYRLVSGDPPWLTWMGRKRRILMIKRL